MTLGRLEQVILFAIAHLGGEAHGARIVEAIEETTGNRVAPGALYTVLDRLEEKGLVESWLGDSTPERGGRRRKVYRLLPEGATELRSWYRGIQSLASGAFPLLDRLAEEAAR